MHKVNYTPSFNANTILELLLKSFPKQVQPATPLQEVRTYSLAELEKLGALFATKSQ